jgi:SET domain-containing protein
MKLFQKLAVVLLVSFVSCFGKTYKIPNGIAETKAETVAQKKNLFKSVGCEYSNVMEVGSSDFNKLKPKETEYYKDNKSTIDELSKKYRHQVMSHHLAPMYLKWISPEVGHGIFAAHNTKKDDFVGVYTGTLRPVKPSTPTDVDDLDYAWYYTIDGVDGKKLIVDGKYKGNELRFINHAKKPNTRLVSVLANGKFYICYIATKDIPKGSQLTVDYGDGYWTSRSIKIAEFK